MKKIKVIVKDQRILELAEDGKAGDIIDLNELVSVDQTPILAAIEKEKDAVYAIKLKEAAKNYELELKAALAEQKSLNEQEKSQLEHQIKLLKTEEANKLKIKEQEVSAQYEKAQTVQAEQLVELKHQIKTLELTHNQALQKIKADKELEKVNEVNEKENELNSLKQKLANSETIYEKELQIVKSEHQNALVKKDNEIDVLTREKNLRNVTQVGAELEKWCNEQYKATTTFGFKTSTWEKDTKAVRLEGEQKATKGDYIFRVYTDETHTIEVTSAMLEMKSAELESETRQKNADHYKKLDKDRNNKGCEYAILVSELEYDTQSDAPIFVVPDYPKMFVVRPHYFITLLGIIESIGLKYAELLTAQEKEKIAFKDLQAILDEFEEFKKSILERSLRHIETQINAIKAEAEKIKKSSESILESTRIVSETHLQTVKNKIENYNITKTVTNIEKLDI